MLYRSGGTESWIIERERRRGWRQEVSRSKGIKEEKSRAYDTHLCHPRAHGQLPHTRHNGNRHINHTLAFLRSIP